MFSMFWFVSILSGHFECYATATEIKPEHKEEYTIDENYTILTLCNWASGIHWYSLRVTILKFNLEPPHYIPY